MVKVQAIPVDTKMTRKMDKEHLRMVMDAYMLVNGKIII